MNASIRSAADLLVDLDLMDWGRVANLRSLGVNREFNEICLAQDASYEEVYVSGLSLRHFNFCLNDHSYFQLSEGECGLRLAYYPNPFIDPDGLLDLIEDPVDFDAFETDELRATAGRSPLRFDLSVQQYVEVSHPCAHFHLGHGELGRLGSRRKYCPYTFVLLVVRLYYPEKWALTDAAACREFEDGMEGLLASRLQRNGFIQPAYFSAKELGVVHVA